MVILSCNDLARRQGGTLARTLLLLGGALQQRRQTGKHSAAICRRRHPKTLVVWSKADTEAVVGGPSTACEPARSRKCQLNAGTRLLFLGGGQGSEGPPHRFCRCF